ncbi:MAG: hypothetical protein V4628_08290 [Pseudomonadota bacterium]
MPHKSTVERDAEIVAMRGLGCSVAAITKEMKVSSSTVNRIFKKHSAEKGVLIDEAISKAKEDAISSLLSEEKLKLLATATVRKSLVMKELMDEEIIKAIALVSKDPSRALISARALTSIANAIKLSNDSLRSAIKIAPLSSYDEATELPDLYVVEYTDEELRQIVSQGEQDHKDDVNMAHY